MEDGGGKRLWGWWGVLPVCEGGGDPGPRGSWRGGPLSSSPPPAPGSAVQTAPPAPWPTPAEPLRSHTAPYTLHGPKGKEGGGGVTYIHTASNTLQHKERVSDKNTEHTSQYRKICWTDTKQTALFRPIWFIGWLLGDSSWDAFLEICLRWNDCATENLSYL